MQIKHTHTEKKRKETIWVGKLKLTSVINPTMYRTNRGVGFINNFHCVSLVIHSLHYEKIDWCENSCFFIKGERKKINKQKTNKSRLVN